MLMSPAAFACTSLHATSCWLLSPGASSYCLLWLVVTSSFHLHLPLSFPCRRKSSPHPMLKIPQSCRLHRPPNLSLLAALVTNCCLPSMLPSMVDCYVICCPFACSCIVHHPHLSALPLCNCWRFCCWLPFPCCRPPVSPPLVMPPLAGCCRPMPPHIVCYGWLSLLAFVSILPLSLPCCHLSSLCPALTIPPPPHHCHCPPPLLFPAALVTNRCTPSKLLLMVGCCVACCPFACHCVVCHPHFSASPLCDHWCFYCWLPSPCCQLPVPLPLVMPSLAGYCPPVPPHIVCYGWMLLLAFASILPLLLPCRHSCSPRPTLTIPYPCCLDCPPPLLSPTALVANCRPPSMLPSVVGCHLICRSYACSCIIHCPHLSAPLLWDCWCFQPSPFANHC